MMQQVSQTANAEEKVGKKEFLKKSTNQLRACYIDLGVICNKGQINAERIENSTSNEFFKMCVMDDMADESRNTNKPKQQIN